MAKVVERRKKPTQHETLKLSTMQQHSHENTFRIASRRRILQFQVSELEAEITQLQAAMINAKQHKKLLETRIEAMTETIARR